MSFRTTVVPREKLQRGFVVTWTATGPNRLYRVMGVGSPESSTCVLAPLEGTAGRVTGVPKDQLLYANPEHPAFRRYVESAARSQDTLAQSKQEPPVTMRGYTHEEAHGKMVPSWER